MQEQLLFCYIKLPLDVEVFGLQIIIWQKLLSPFTFRYRNLDTEDGHTMVWHLSLTMGFIISLLIMSFFCVKGTQNSSVTLILSNRRGSNAFGKGSAA